MKVNSFLWGRLKMILGKKSLQNLEGVHPGLVAVVKKSVQLIKDPFDFSVHDGLRTIEEQKKLFNSGASKTMDSRHLTGHAVDLVPYLNGKLRWEWPLIYPIATAVRLAAQELNIPIRWGAAWDINITDTGNEPVYELVDQYVERKKEELISLGKKPIVFIDGPHFELPRGIYP